MKKELLLCLLILTSVVTFVTPTPTASAQTGPVTFLWSIDMNVYDVAVSNDGKYMAATGWYEEVNCLLYFDTNNPEPIWNCSGEDLDFDGVAISADGSEVVVGASSSGSGFLMYFNESQSRTGNQLYNWTWATYGLGGNIERDCLDMSDDGDYVVAGGTGWSVYYYANCTNSTLRYTANEDTTWGESTEDEVVTLDLSSNGRFLVVGTQDWTYWNGSVLYYKDAWNYDPGVTPDLKWTYNNGNLIFDVSVSDDGYSVAMVDEHNFFYWANALTLNDGADNGPIPTWGTDEDEFRDVDLSSDGNEVFIGSVYYDTVFFMSDARTKIEYVPPEDFTWQALSDHYVYDVALSDDGQIAVATAESCGLTGCKNYAFFYKSNGDVIGSYQVADEEYEVPTSLSMSGNGGIVAIGTEPDSNLLVFKVKIISPVQYFSVTLDPSNASYLVGEIYPLDDPRKVSVYVEVEPDGMEFDDQFVVFAMLLQNGTWKVLANDYYIINYTTAGGDPWALLIWDQLPVAEGIQIWVVRTHTDESFDSDALTFQVIIHDFGEDKLDLILQMLNDPNTGLAEIKNEIRDIEDYVDNIDSYYWELRDQIIKVNNTIVNRLYWMSDNYTVSLTNITTMLETIYDKLGIPVVGGLLVPLQIPFYIMAVAPYLAAILAGILALLFLARRMGR